MPLGPGTRLGPYEIQSAIGAGGMGEVYRATDTSLGRQVAIKVLPETFATDPDRLARFEREAKTLASLNHPNIAIIHGLEKSQGTYALVMELVEGEDLSQRIARGPIPLDEALPMAKQIAEALEAAHEQGIVHRDLKPANIKVSPDGNVKVLDFGLAKWNEPNGPNDSNSPNAFSISPTITSPALMTGIGTLLGTAAYMAPEQARGRPADKRADIWAFGCVLYEMLSGTRAFDGDDMAVVLASVIKTDPNWSLLPARTPPAIVATITQCLQKDPKQRIHDAGDVRLALQGAFAFAAAQTHTSAAPQRWRRPLVVGSLALLAGAIVAGGGVWFATRPPAAPVVTLTVAHPGSETIGGTNLDVVISPDGRQVTYLASANGETRLYTRPLDKLASLRLASDAVRGELFVSPDGQWIGFTDSLSLKKVPIGGGPVIAIATAPADIGTIQGASWGPDGSIVFGSSASGLFRIPPAGGSTVRLTDPNNAGTGESHRHPEVLPSGRGIVYTIYPASGQAANARIAVLDVSTGQQRVIVEGGTNPRYVSAGFLVYGVTGTLRAVRFDPQSMTTRGNPTQTLGGVVTKANGSVSFTVAANGTLAYIAGQADTAKRTLVWIDRDGREEPLNVPPRAYAYAILSPDGGRIALDVREDSNDIWIWDVRRQTLTRLTFDPGLNRGPRWTPDGRRVVYSAARDGTENIFSQAADGSSPPEVLTHEKRVTGPTSFTPDGSHLLFFQPAGPPYDIGVLSLQGERRAELVLHESFSESNGEISPDGRWLAYQSDESGRNEIYVRPFPNLNNGRWQVSTDGGTRPLWGRNGRELFYYVPPGTLMAAPIQPGSTFTAGTPQQLFKGTYLSPQTGRQYDVTPDGRRFLLIKDATPADESASRPQLVIVQNWFQELQRLVPTR